MAKKDSSWCFWPPATWMDAALYAWLALLAVSVFISLGPGWERAAYWWEEQDLPAWVQALGSVGAIFMAIWVTSQTRVQAGELEERRMRVTRNARAEVVFAVCSNARAILEELDKAYRLNGLSKITSKELSFLNEAGEGFRVLPLFEIPDPYLAAKVALMPHQMRELKEAFISARDEGMQNEAVANPIAPAYRSQTVKAADPDTTELELQLKSAFDMVLEAGNDCIRIRASNS